MPAAFRSEWIKMKRPGILIGAAAMSALPMIFVPLSIVTATSSSGGGFVGGPQALTTATLSGDKGLATLLSRGGFFISVVALVIVASATVNEYSTGVIRNGGTGPASAAAGSTPASEVCESVEAETGAEPMSSQDMSESQLIGQAAGTREQGNASLTVPPDQVGTLGDTIPAGATADACTDTVSFTAGNVSLVIEASPTVNPDMTFRVGALINPTLVIPLGAHIDIEFINADSDQAHAWTLTTAQPPSRSAQATNPPSPARRPNPSVTPLPPGRERAGSPSPPARAEHTGTSARCPATLRWVCTARS